MTFARVLLLLGVTVAPIVAGCTTIESTTEPAGKGPFEPDAGVSVVPRGIDVSHHNGSVEWGTVKASGGQSFAFARISDGLTQPDETFDGHWRAMKSAGLVRGAYQFFRARRDGVPQADLLLQMVADAGGFQSGDLPPVLDIETADGQDADVVVERCQTWLGRIESALGVRPIVYTGNQMKSVLGDALASYVLWIAHYDVPSPTIPPAWDTWRIWQNSASGRVAGVTGEVDTNVFNGDRDDLLALTVRAPRDLSSLAGRARPAAPSLDELVGRPLVPPDARMGDGLRALAR